MEPNRMLVHRTMLAAATKATCYITHIYRIQIMNVRLLLPLISARSIYECAGDSMKNRFTEKHLTSEAHDTFHLGFSPG